MANIEDWTEKFLSAHIDGTYDDIIEYFQQSKLQQPDREQLREELLRFADFKDAMKSIYDLMDKNLVVDKYLNPHQ